MSDTADDLAAEWRASTEGDAGSGWSRLDDAASERPDIAWQTIVRAVAFDLTREQLSVLAAGPLEVLLSSHGPDFIDRVEQEAAHNPRFNDLLGGVWRLEMSDDVWSRVQKARHSTW